jgi:hypothetical protein
MLQWNLFAAPCILAAYFSTLTIEYSNVFIFTGISVILLMHCMWPFLLQTPMSQFLQLYQHSVSGMLEISLFLILCQSIGERNTTQYSIPTEYAYLPLLIVSLIATNRGTRLHTELDGRWELEAATFIAFLVIFHTRCTQKRFCLELLSECFEAGGHLDVPVQ